MTKLKLHRSSFILCKWEYCILKYHILSLPSVQTLQIPRGNFYFTLLDQRDLLPKYHTGQKNGSRQEALEAIHDDYL